MMRPAFLLTQTPYAELLEDIQLLLAHDAEELEQQTAYFQRLRQEGQRSADYLDRFERRLQHAQTRHEFFTTLLCRLQTYDFRYLVKAIEEAKQLARQNGRPEQYGFTILFQSLEEPTITLYQC
ncbi:MAG: hypothetical protein AAFV95_28960 [Bacteroidota bacterium]